MRQVSHTFKTGKHIGKEKKSSHNFSTTPLKIAITTQNTTGKLLSTKQNPNQGKFDKC
jgi:hypothetical protein